MADKLNTLHDLLVHELQDLYDAEQRLVKALPKMAKAANTPQLKAAFESHLRETEQQVKRLEQAFTEMGLSAEAKTCAAMKGLVEEGSDMISEDADPMVKDAGLIVAAQKVEHYEIASYGSACVFAEVLGLSRVKQILKQTMAEEEAADKKLTQLAEGFINQQAVNR